MVSFWKYFLIILDNILMTFLTFCSYLFLVTFLTFRGSKPKREPGEGGVDPAYKGIPALKLPPLASVERVVRCSGQGVRGVRDDCVRGCQVQK